MFSNVAKFDMFKKHDKKGRGGGEGGRIVLVSEKKSREWVKEWGQRRG
jgi:hypothetical protein